MAHIEQINGETVLVDKWYVQDVMAAADCIGIRITVDQAENVLILAASKHDACTGINWTVLEHWIDFVVSRDEKTQRVDERA